MQVRTDCKNGPPVASPTDAIKDFQQQTETFKDQWRQQLQDNPDAFAEVEQQIDTYYRQGAGKLVASLLATRANPKQFRYCSF